MGNNKIPLNEFITLQRGFDLPKNDRMDGSVPVVASTRVGGYHNTAKVKAPGVVIGRSGSIGGGQYIKTDFWPLNTTLWVKDFKGHNPRFVYYLLKSIDFSTFNVGSGVPTLNRNHLCSLMIDNIGLDSEKKIAQILGKLDDKIELNQQTNQTLEQIAQTLFKSWFVDFDPVFDNMLAKIDFDLNKLPNDFPAGLLKRAEKRLEQSGQLSAISGQLKPDTATPTADSQKPTALPHPDFPSEFEYNEQLGWIPKGWENGTLASVADALSGYAFKGKYFSEDGCAVIKIKNISSDRTVGIYDVNRVPQTIASTTERFLLSDGDIVIAMTGATVGKFGVIVSEKSEPYYLNQRVCKLSPKMKNGSSFLFSALNNPGVEESIVSAAQGSAQPNISATGILSLKLLVPTNHLIDLFNSQITMNFEKKLILRKENYTLIKLRDTLLPKLISGELQIPNLETA